MLTRRQLLTAVAAAPLAKFCKTEPACIWVDEPVRLYGVVTSHRWVTRGGTVIQFAQLDHPVGESPLTRAIRELESLGMRTGLTPSHYGVERRYALPQGTLG